MILLFLISAVNIALTYYVNINLIYINLILIFVFALNKNLHFCLTFIFSLILLLAFLLSSKISTFQNNVYKISSIKTFEKFAKTNVHLEVLDNLGNKQVFLLKNNNLKFKVNDLVIVDNANIKLMRRPITSKIKEKYLESLNKFFDKIHLSYSHFSKAIITNDKSELSKYEIDMFRNAGISHILVVSGLHFSLIFLIIYFFTVFIKNEKIRYLISIFILLNYLILTSFSPSALRSFIMIFVFITYKIIYGKINLLSSLSLSFIINSIFFRDLLSSVGFKLSYLAVMGIALSYYLLKKYELSTIKSSLLTTFTIQVFTAPVLYFNNFNLPIAGAISNLVITPLIFLFLLISTLSILFYYLNLDLLILLDNLNFYVFKLVKGTAFIFSNFFVIENDYIPIFILSSALFLIFTVVNLTKEKLKIKILN